MLHRVLWGVLALVLVGVAGAGAWSLVREGVRPGATVAGASPRLPVYGSVPEFSLIERGGRRVARSDLLGRVWIADFIYTNCPDTCPLMTARMAQLQSQFAAEKDVRLVSITIDPERDTREVLSRYADRFRADPERWLFLTGKKEATYRLVQEGFRLSVVDPKAVRSPLEEVFPSERPEPRRGPEAGRQAAKDPPDLGVFGWALDRLLAPPPALAHEGRGGDPIHASRFVLVDRQGRIRGYYDSDDAEALERLRRDVRTLLREA